MSPNDPPTNRIRCAALDRLDEEYKVEAGELVRFDGSRKVSPMAFEPSTAVSVLARSPETDDEGVPAT